MLSTVIDGQQCLVTHWNGTVTVLDGPCHLPVSYKSKEILQLLVATTNQYIEIVRKDGKTQIFHGPSCHSVNPITDKGGLVKDALKIGEQELIVIYEPDTNEPPTPSKTEDAVDAEDTSCLNAPLLIMKSPALNDKTSRRIMYGPGVYIPRGDSEWLHEFSWTGRATHGGVRAMVEEVDCGVKKPNALRFQKLRTSPGKTYYDVASVRTKDGATLTIKLMLFYQVVNVEKLLDNTNDPFADIFSSVSADIIEYVAPLDFNEALGGVHGLNDLETYQQLTKAASKIGITIDKVIFRGYSAPPALQRLHDSAIEAKTNLDLAAQRLREEERQSDERLQASMKRSEDELSLKRRREQEELEWKEKKAKQDLDLQQMIFKMKHNQTLQTQAAEREQLSKINQATKDHLAALKQIDPDMNIGQYMCTKDTPIRTIIQCSSLLHDSSPNTLGSGVSSLAQITAADKTRHSDWAKM